MVYCYPSIRTPTVNKYKHNSVDIKVNKQQVQEVPEKSSLRTPVVKKIKQDYENVKNIVMENNKVDTSVQENKKTNKFNII
jgi:hypothetical protein